MRRYALMVTAWFFLALCFNAAQAEISDGPAGAADAETKRRIVPVLSLLLWDEGAEAKWESCSSLHIGRDQFAAGVIDNKLYVFGGNSAYGNSNSLEIFDTATGTWTLGTAHSYSAGVEEVTGAVIDGAFFVFGAWGGGTPYGVFNFVEKYSPKTKTWSSLAPKPTTNAGNPALVYNGEIYIFGGYYGNDDMEDELQYTVVEAYNPTTNTWRTVTSMPQAYENFAVGLYKDTAYLIGGVYGQEGRYTVQLDVVSYHFPSNTWTTSGLGSLEHFHMFPYSSSAPVLDGKIYLVGGEGLVDPAGPLSEENVQPSSDMLIYDIAAGVFSRGLSLPEPRDDHAVLMHDGYMYVIGGRNSSDEDAHVNTVFRLSVDK
nr:kelch repeat-containing protein [uncultured Desulfobulbus sp.]